MKYRLAVTACCCQQEVADGAQTQCGGRGCADDACWDYRPSAGTGFAAAVTVRLRADLLSRLWWRCRSLSRPIRGALNVGRLGCPCRCSAPSDHSIRACDVIVCRLVWPACMAGIVC